jgi:hypothetical protein
LPLTILRSFIDSKWRCRCVIGGWATSEKRRE